MLLLMQQPYFDSSPIDKFSDWSKLKASADDKINVTEKLKFVLGRGKRTLWETEKNAG